MSQVTAKNIDALIKSKGLNGWASAIVRCSHDENTKIIKMRSEEKKLELAYYFDLHELNVLNDAVEYLVNQVTRFERDEK